ncbi:hypothetical protein Pcinc_009915 [Petrolisthes cinctipes]|uniref:Alpha 1,4-glycosyltransferase domain-containing protein n=1 Tax=Petrolisthes cinctipes TaxID=88211 RepID=A0AAE1G426_PETCI|nr:hypothetical protein Pcinc_009915 [Petrolisthes cinctipes]
MAGHGPQQLIRRRTYRQRRNIFHDYCDDQFIKRFRLDRAGIIAVTDLVRDKLQSRTERSRPLDPETKVAITLRYLATGKMQQCCCDDFGTTQPTISRVITQTLDALADPQIRLQFMRFPRTRDEIQRKQREFMETSGFPGVVGAIDGTHVRIVAPRVDEHLYAMNVSYTIHMYNKMTKELVVKVGGNSLYEITAKNFCPLIYSRASMHSDFF